MRKLTFAVTNLLIAVLFTSCTSNSDKYQSINPIILNDKIAGGWAGKMIGVTYGAPTEFRALSRIYEDSISWTPQETWKSMWQDDIYVQLTFLMTMDAYGIDAPARKFQEMFAKAGYMLWHANMQARKNYYDSIFPPASGSPEFSMHSDDIDFQIESDYLGFMCPGMPQTASKMADKIGRIMNYGDGLYGGIFVAALYSEAFFESDINVIIEKALKSIPAESDYYKIVADVLKLHKHYPDNWKDAWKELEAKWGNVDICGAGAPFNIDAKLNGAYIVMGLLYGDKDPIKTMEIATRCGQDSDCNPSNAMAVLGVIKGFSGLPKKMQMGVLAASDSLFVHTSYTLNSAIISTNNYAQTIIKANGGSISEKEIKVKIQEGKAPVFEDSYPNVVFEKEVSIFEEGKWNFKGNWNVYEQTNPSQNTASKQSMYAEKGGDELIFTFEGTGVSIEGNWVKDGGKADLFVDGNFHRSIDTYYNFANQEHTTSMWHVLNLKPGTHEVKIVVKGEKRPESAGTRIYITKALIFNTKAKTNQDFKFSFE